MDGVKRIGDVSSDDYDAFLERLNVIRAINLNNIAGRAFAIACCLEHDDAVKMRVGGRREFKVDVGYEFYKRVRDLPFQKEKMHASMLADEAEIHGLPSCIYMAQEDLKKKVSSADDLIQMRTYQMFALCFQGYENSGKRIVDVALGEKVSKKNLIHSIESDLMLWYRHTFSL